MRRSSFSPLAIALVLASPSPRVASGAPPAGSPEAMAAELVAKLREEFPGAGPAQQGLVFSRIRALADLGEPGARAIHDYLETGEEPTAPPDHGVPGASAFLLLESGQLTSCPSLRAALVFALGEINGPASIETTSGLLRSSPSAVEAAFAARTLERLEPGKHRSESIAGMRRLMSSAQARPDWENSFTASGLILETLAHFDARETLDDVVAFVSRERNADLATFFGSFLFRFPAEEQLRALERLRRSDPLRTFLLHNCYLSSLDFRSPEVRRYVVGTYTEEMNDADRRNLVSCLPSRVRLLTTMNDLFYGLEAPPPRDPARIEGALALLDEVEATKLGKDEIAKARTDFETLRSWRPRSQAPKLPPLPSSRAGAPPSTPEQLLESLFTELEGVEAEEGMRRIEVAVARLRDGGDASVGAIRAFLGTGRDRTWRGGHLFSEQLVPDSLRVMLILLLGYIDSPHAVDGSLEVLGSSRNAAEIALAARNLTGKPASRDAVVAAVVQLLRGLVAEEALPPPEKSWTGFDFFREGWITDVIGFYRIDEAVDPFTKLLQLRSRDVPLGGSFLWFALARFPGEAQERCLSASYLAKDSKLAPAPTDMALLDFRHEGVARLLSGYFATLDGAGRERFIEAISRSGYHSGSFMRPDNDLSHDREMTSAERRERRLAKVRWVQALRDGGSADAHREAIAKSLAELDRLMTKEP